MLLIIQSLVFTSNVVVFLIMIVCLGFQVSRVWLKTVPCRCQKTLSCRCCQQRSSRTNIDATSSETTLRCVGCLASQGSAVLATEKAQARGRGVRMLPCFFPGANLWLSFTLSSHQPLFPLIFTARRVKTSGDRNSINVRLLSFFPLCVNVNFLCVVAVALANDTNGADLI